MDENNDDNPSLLGNNRKTENPSFSKTSDIENDDMKNDNPSEGEKNDVNGSKQKTL